MISRLFIIACFAAITVAVVVGNDREKARIAMIKEEDLLTTGGHITLDKNEEKANKNFLNDKRVELENGFKNPEAHAASMHFFKAKPLIDKSKVFKFLQKMPKGAVLHIHTLAAVSSDWVVKNIFHMEGLWKCTNKEGINILTFRKQSEAHGCAKPYVKVSDERKKSSSASVYDKTLEKSINLYSPSPELEYSTTNKVWKKFQNLFRTITDALNYLPAFRAYHRQMLQELYDDNVMYAEVRLDFLELYDINGRTYPVENTVKELIDVIEIFKREHSDFLGIKMIHAVHRKAEKDVIQKGFEKFKKLHSKYPDYIVGFDLVGQEDIGEPLHKFIDVIKDKPKNAKFFFHAGETNWYGSTTDQNLYDAVLLDTTRIGHGYALMKHPVIYKEVMTRKIAVEVSPISNQVLNLVWDLRNHPGAFFISQNTPMVICNDDPGFWNSKGLSYDFYYAIMSMAPNNAGLKTLKQLVWNSIEYSAMDPKEKKIALVKLKKRWDSFINDVSK